MIYWIGKSNFIEFKDRVINAHEIVHMRFSESSVLILFRSNPVEIQISFKDSAELNQFREEFRTIVLPSLK